MRNRTVQVKISQISPWKIYEYIIVMNKLTTVVADKFEISSERNFSFFFVFFMACQQDFDENFSFFPDHKLCNNRDILLSPIVYWGFFFSLFIMDYILKLRDHVFFLLMQHFIITENLRKSDASFFSLYDTSQQTFSLTFFTRFILYSILEFYQQLPIRF